MNDSSSETEGLRQSPGRADQQLLDHLENLLRRQLELARKDDLAEMSACLAEMPDRLRSAAPPGPSPELIAQAERIAQLHRRLSLTLTQKKREIADKLAHLRKGKGACGAYGQ